MAIPASAAISVDGPGGEEAQPIVFKVVYENRDPSERRVRVTRGGETVEGLDADDIRADYVINGNL